METNSRKHVSFISFRGLVLIFLCILSLAIFILLSHEVVVENEDWFDTMTFSFFSKSIPPEIIWLFRDITYFGSSKFLFPSYVILILLLIYKRRKRNATYVALAGMVSILMIYGLKLTFTRKRPDSPLFDVLTSYSFPSGHSLSSIVFFGILIVFIQTSKLAKLWKGVISFFICLFVLAIGISRIVLNYHYASDVVAGYCLGLIIVVLFSWLHQSIKGKVDR